MNRGVLYLAKGSSYRNEALQSASRVSKVMPDTPISIVSDEDISEWDYGEVIIDDSEYSIRDKPKALQSSPYEKTIYLDTDTYMYSDILEVFQILDNFEMALVRDHMECNIRELSDHQSLNNVPEGFPELNSGFIAIKKTPMTMEFLKKWEQRCQPEHGFDQRSLRPALYHSEVRFTLLPPVYNCIYSVNGCVTGEVKVFHLGMGNRNQVSLELETAIEKLNATTSPRIYQPYENTLLVNLAPSLIQKLLITFRHRGFLETMIRIKNKIT